MEKRNTPDLFFDISKILFGISITTYLSALLLAASCLFSSGMQIQIRIVAAIFSGYDVIYSAVLAIKNKRWLHPDLFALVAVIGTYFLGLFGEACLAMIVYVACRGILISETEDMQNTVTYTSEIKGYSKEIDRRLSEMSDSPSNIERKVKKAGAIYSACLIICILLLTIIVPLIWRVPFIEWLRRAFILLVAACPGALSLCAESEYYKGLNLSAVHGILYRRRGVIEDAAKVTSVVFKKSDGISNGDFRIAKAIPIDISKDKLLILASYACALSDDSIAVSVCLDTGVNVDTSYIDGYKRLPELGYAVIIGGIKVAVGNEDLMEKLRIPYHPVDALGTVLYVAVGGKFAGYLLMLENCEKNNMEAVSHLFENDIDRIVLLSALENKDTKLLAEQMGIQEYYSDLDDKKCIEKISSLQKMQMDNEKLAYVGDGYSDIPIMECADITISIGTESLASHADIIIPSENYEALADALRICENIKDDIAINLITAGVFKFIIIILALSGVGGIWLAACIDMISSIVVIRCAAGDVLRKRKKKKEKSI